VTDDDVGATGEVASPASRCRDHEDAVDLVQADGDPVGAARTASPELEEGEWPDDASERRAEDRDQDGVEEADEPLGPASSTGALTA